MSILGVLIVEDSENDSELLAIELRRGGWLIDHERVETPNAMTIALGEHHWDIIIADYSLPHFSGPAALSLARQFAPDVPLFLVSGTVGVETAVAAMQAGACDYLFKGDLSRLVPAVQRERRGVAKREAAREIERLLDAREAQLAEALRLAKLGTWNLNLQSNTAEFSDEAQLLLGRQPGASLSTFSGFLECLHPDDRGAFAAAFSDRVGTQIAQDCRLISPDATATFVHIRGQIVRDAVGNPTMAGGMIQDITEHRAKYRNRRCMPSCRPDFPRPEAIGICSPGCAC
jgi:DNA-binding response OmpR family regulator